MLMHFSSQLKTPSITPSPIQIMVVGKMLSELYIKFSIDTQMLSTLCAVSRMPFNSIICQFRVRIEIIGQQKRPIENMNAFVPLHVRVSECLISGLSRWRGRRSVGLLHLSGSCPATPAGSSSGFYLPSTAAAGNRPPSQIAAAGWTG